ncbi:amidohydrolase family protein [Pelotomaculum propionicicum]|uniref:amidohydrolase family protein n=1 Tax=Pelotomaculum propionicicum TaxID=258475 RepID=UPI003B76A4E9
MRKKHMIIDAHTHIYPDRVAEKAVSTILGNTKGKVDAHTDGTFDNLLSSMETAGVDLSIVLTVATTREQGCGILRWLRQMVDRTPRMIYFGSVHPYDPNNKSVIHEMIEMGIQGLKFHPAYQGFPADSREAYKVFEEALKNDLILYFHSGFDLSMPDTDYASIERFVNVLRDFAGDGVKIIMAHAGGDGEWEKILDLYGDKKCYYDTSFVLEKMVLDENAKELYRQNEDYFIFGSDSPWRDQKKYVDFLSNSDLFSQEQKDKLFYKNILKLIKI